MSPPNEPPYRDEHLTVDLVNHVVTLDSEILALTGMEYRLLAVLVKHAGEVVPQPILLTLTPLVDMHFWRLRKKLGKYGNQYIEAVTESDTVSGDSRRGTRVRELVHDPATVSRLRNAFGTS